VGVGLCNKLTLGCNHEPYVVLDVCLNMLNFGHKGCLIVLRSVMVSRLVTFGAATKPRASCGAQHKVVLLGMCNIPDVRK
jgi:hypothetical protein